MIYVVSYTSYNDGDGYLYNESIPFTDEKKAWEAQNSRIADIADELFDEYEDAEEKAQWLSEHKDETFVKAWNDGSQYMVKMTKW